MSVTWEMLKVAIGDESFNNDAFIQSCLEEASALVAAYVATSVVPEVIRDRAVLEVGADLFNRREAPNGIRQYETADGASPMRIARDPMAAAYPLLRRWVMPF